MVSKGLQSERCLCSWTFGGMFSVFLFGFDMASVAKAQQKMSNPCTSRSRNLELHSTMSIFLLAASLNFQLYWRALPSFPVLANTGSGKLWLAQKLKVHRGKHPQGFREGGVRGGRELGHLRGRPPWPVEAHFAQKVTQSHSHELPLPKKFQKDVKKYMQGCHIGRFIEILRKNGAPRTPKVV